MIQPPLTAGDMKNVFQDFFNPFFAEMVLFSQVNRQRFQRRTAQVRGFQTWGIGAVLFGTTLWTSRRIATHFGHEGAHLREFDLLMAGVQFLFRALQVMPTAGAFLDAAFDKAVRRDKGAGVTNMSHLGAAFGALAPQHERRVGLFALGGWNG
jgi:hypothetical protein